MGVSTYVMPTAPVGLRRMCELRNCHFRGDFVTEAAHHLGAAETVKPPRAILLRKQRRRGKPNTKPPPYGGDCWVFLKLTTLSCRSTRKKDFAERFFAKRSGERFKRGVRLCRITRRVRSAVTTSVRGKKCEPAINYVREEGCLPLRYSICAYLRSSRQGAFCGHSAMPNAALFTPVAPLHENLFIENIFVIAAVHFSESEPPRAILLRKQRRRGKPNTKPPPYGGDCWVFLKLTTFSFISLKEKV